MEQLQNLSLHGLFIQICWNHDGQGDRALHVPEEGVSQPTPLACAFDQARDISDDVLGCIRWSHYPKVGHQCSERIVGNLGASPGDICNERRLSHIGFANEAHISLQLELQIEPILLSNLTLFRKARGTAPIGEKPSIAGSSSATPCHNYRRTRLSEVGEERSVEASHYRPQGDADDLVAPVGTMHLLPLAVSAITGSSERLIPEHNQ
jgi:hypothetical protein